MFGFLRPHNREHNSGAFPAAASWPPGTLVCKEDIYRENKGLAPILLLRKGYEVSPEELPRFIRNGARPHQFLFKPAEEETSDSDLLTAMESLPLQVKTMRRQLLQNGMDNDIPLLPSNEASGRRSRVLILEPNQKSLKRLIDCLFICGTPLDRIHTVRVPEQLAWALEKYRPQILIVDYALPNQTGLQLLASLQSLAGVQKIIFTAGPEASISNEKSHILETFCPDKRVKVLKKPVTRFTVNRILAE